MLDTSYSYAKIYVVQKQEPGDIMNLINTKQAIELIESTRAQGTIFTATFEKRTTGDIRKMNARLGVKKGVTGEGMKYDPKGKNLIACYDVQKAQEMKAQGLDEVTSAKKSYRMINAEKLLNATGGGEFYQVYTVDKL